MSTYGKGTMEIIKHLGEADLKIAEVDGSIELRLDEKNIRKLLPKYNKLASEVIIGSGSSANRKHQLAERYGVDRSILSKITAGKHLFIATRNLVLCSLLDLDPLPTVDEANHTLMKLRRPGLFTETAYGHVNQRNRILIQILNFGQEHPCPMKSWQDYTNAVLDYFDMELLSKRHEVLPLPDEELSRLKQWRPLLEQVPPTDYAVVRRAYLEEYLKAKGWDAYGGKTKAYECLATELNVQYDRAKTLFGLMGYDNSRGSREAIITLGIAMGRTLRETNRMLLQIDKELLYPNQSNEQELCWVQQLLKNEKPHNS